MIPDTTKRPVRAPLSASADDYLRDMVAEIVGTLRDTHSTGFYAKVAKVLPEEAVRNILGGVRQMLREGTGLEVARKTFTATAKKRAREIGVEL